MRSEEKRREDEEARTARRAPWGGRLLDGKQPPSTPTPDSPQPSCCAQLGMASGSELEVVLSPRSPVGSRGLDRGTWPL